MIGFSLYYCHSAIKLLQKNKRTFVFDPGGLAPGPHRITLRVTDTSAETADAVVDLVVNEPPIANAGLDLVVAEGDEVTFDGSLSQDFEDALFDTTWTFEDGTTVPSVSTSRIYPQNGDFMVALDVTDTAGSVSSDQVALVVENVPPSILSVSDITGTTNQIVQFDATFFDPGVNDTHTAVIDWGDGTTSDGTIILSDGQPAVTASHTYLQPGIFSIRLTVEDSDGDSTEASSVATITAASKVYQVPGEPGEYTKVRFEWTEREAAFNNELGLYEVANFDGEVDGTLPGDPDYVQKTLNDPSHQVIFESGDTVGEVRELLFPAGTLLALYMVQDGSSDQLISGPQNHHFFHHPAPQPPNVWTIFANANSDGFDHFQCEATEADGVLFRVEDQTNGGDQDFNDMVFTITSSPFEPGNTKFFVVDDKREETFHYDVRGELVQSTSLASENDRPRGATSNVFGDTLWVIDNSRRIHVYDALGGSQGSWRASEAWYPEGIATDGEDIWVVSKWSRRVYHYEEGAALRAGSHDSSDAFRLHYRNRYASGIATDGQTIWVSDSLRDEVFVYDVDGSYRGSWDLDHSNRDPSGITNDPNGGDDLWVVDRRDDVVYHYSGGTNWRNGHRSADSSFPLAPGNSRPEGIADPPIDSRGTEFWLSFNPNYPERLTTRSLFISGESDTVGEVKIPESDFSQEFTVTANQVTQIILHQ